MEEGDDGPPGTGGPDQVRLGRRPEPLMGAPLQPLCGAQLRGQGQRCLRWKCGKSLTCAEDGETQRRLNGVGPLDLRSQGRRDSRCGSPQGRVGSFGAPPKGTQEMGARRRDGIPCLSWRVGRHSGSPAVSSETK